MKNKQYFIHKVRERKGATAVIVAVMLMTLLGFVVLAVDTGYVMVTKNELQNVADSAALAGARMLGRLYECNGNIVTCTGPMPYPNQLTYVADAALIKQAVTDVASANQAGGKAGIDIIPAEIVIGNWVPDSSTSKMKVSPTLTSPDAVQVIARRDSSANSPIRMFFAHIMGINFVDVSVVATAALTGSSTMGPGGLSLPVAINKSWMSTVPCNQNLTFHPSSAGTCSAWHSYDPASSYNPNAAQLRQMLDDLAALTYSSPETTAGETQFDFTNGTLASLFTHDNIQNLFNVMKIKNDGKLDFDTDSSTWTTSVPVFDDTRDGCAPNGLITIVGFATIVITGVDPPPTTTIYATVKCDVVEPGRGGGSYYGTKGTIPQLVQ
jgi:Flp pilus assembly protein TadG